MVNRTKTNKFKVTLGFRRDVDGDCALLSCYAASIGNVFPKYLDNLSVPYSGV